MLEGLLKWTMSPHRPLCARDREADERRRVRLRLTGFAVLRVVVVGPDDVVPSKIEMPGCSLDILQDRLLERFQVDHASVIVPQ